MAIGKAAKALVALTMFFGLALLPAVVSAETKPFERADHRNLATLKDSDELSREGFMLELNPAKLDVAQGNPARFDLLTILGADYSQQLDLQTLLLKPSLWTEDENLDSTEEETLTQGADSPQNPSNELWQRRVELKGVGVWEIDGSVITFTPYENANLNEVKIDFQISTYEGVTSAAHTLSVNYPGAPEVFISASEGVKVEIPMDFNPKLVDPESFKFILSTMPFGSTLTRDGYKLIVPLEGTWNYDPQSSTVTFTPQRERIGFSPSPVNYALNDITNSPLPKGKITLATPSLSSIVTSNPYGEPIEYSLSSYGENILPHTFELIAYSDDLQVQSTSTEQKLVVPKQGVWELNRQDGVLIFTPENPLVREITPVGVRGQDASGNYSSIAPVSVGYPQVLSIHRAFTWGSQAVFSPLSGSLHTQSDSLSLTLAGMPPGSKLSENQRTLVVPQQGVWEFDISTLTVTFTPDSNLNVQPTALTYKVSGIYVGNETTGVLTAQYADSVPISRDDEAVTVSQLNSINIDVLANDIPASAAQPLDPSTLLLRSASSSNIEELIAGSGSRLVIPDEGIFEITNAGSVRFTPARGFVGRTTPIDYSVEDTTGLRSSARLIVEVEPHRGLSNPNDQNSGINNVFSRLMPAYPRTFSMFAAIVGLLIFTGMVALWVGREIELLKENR